MSNSNKIKIARSLSRGNLPNVLEYGEPAYVKNAQFIIGNGDGSEFVVNNWNNLINRPTGDFVSITAGDNLAPFTPVAIDENGHAVVADKGNELRARVYGFTQSSASTGSPVNLQISGNITNPAWSLITGTTYFLGTAGDLVSSTAGFIATDIIAPLGIALDTHTLALNIELGYLPGVTSMNGRAGAVTVTQADVGLANVENTKLSTWIGTTNISTVGVITSGTWNGNTITVDRGGTGLTAPGAANTLLGVAADGQHLEYKELVAGDGISFTYDANKITVSSSQPQFNTLIQTNDVLDYLTVAHSLACRFDVVYYTEDRVNVRFETILATIGANDTVSWNAITTHEIGDTSGITSIISADTMKIVYGFGITSGSWRVSVVPFAIALPGLEPTYAALPI
jgi:hypothetical protein